MSDPMLAANRRFYDQLWTDARLIGPERLPSWGLVQKLARGAVCSLEVGAGLRPRLPLAGTFFVDISLPALRALQAAGGYAVAGQATALPFMNGAFNLVCALDIVEHVADDEAALAELSRVAAAGAALLLSVPLHQAAWSAFDEAVGHYRRYEPGGLLALLAAHGFVLEASAAAGMLPRSGRLVALGMWFLQHRRARAMWWFNRVFMPLGLRWAKPVVLQPGLIDTNGVAGVLLLCRKQRQMA